MAVSPLIPLAVVTLSFGFQAMLGNTEYFTDTFPSIEEPESICADTNNPVVPDAIESLGDGVKCGLSWIWFFFQFLFGIIVFFAKVLGFYIPGAPWYIQLPLSTFSIGSIGWSIAELFRGT